MVPLVDVSLVLLIIVLVTATFVKTAGVSVDLPSSTSARAISPAKRELVIAVDSSGRFSWDGARVTDVGLADELRKEAAAYGTRSRVTVRGDRRAEYGRVVAAMAAAHEAGFVSLVVAVRHDAGNSK